VAYRFLNGTPFAAIQILDIWGCAYKLTGNTYAVSCRVKGKQQKFSLARYGQ
jgi:hypothetical protein